MMKTAKLLLHCPDKPDVLTEVTGLITVNKRSIIYLNQHVNHVGSIFFVRIKWELENFLVPQGKIKDYFETLYTQKYRMNFRLYFPDAKPRMAVFMSKMSHCLFDLLARYMAGRRNVEIPLVIGNHPNLQHVAECFDIPFHFFPITKETEEEQEKGEMELLAKHRVNFIVPACYMQVIPEKVTDTYPNRVIDIRHSFLPAFVDTKPYRAAFERGVKIIGATGHHVTTELDAGPIIEQDVVRITHKDAVQDLVNKSKDLERIVLSRAVRGHIKHRILAYRNKTIIFSQQLVKAAVIKYNAGNIRSVGYVLRRLGVETEITADEAVLRVAGKVIFLGVGKMETTMNFLNGGNMGQLVKELHQPVLGICLGMQLMCRHSEEGNVDRLDIFDVDVKRFVSQKHGGKVPHIGWNTITQTNGDLFKGFTKEEFIYFVHSFYIPVSDCTAAVTNYILPFSAALHKGGYYATRFHPEKSGSVDGHVLQNFLGL